MPSRRPTATIPTATLTTAIDTHMTQASDEFLTTRELADLLRIKERKVYELA
ncbi:MAG: hypothetical protein GWP66_13980, partial [Gammaproteobacteria bacterium]|nr:hypothetical protein [Gammaproteobacteria bacterium]